MPYFPLVTLQAGRRGVNPWFCVPGAGAGVASFAPLAGCYEQDRPVYGFQHLGLDGDRAPHTTVASMVACYLEAIQATHPTGPVHLLGHSFGGWIALEMAHGLSALGRTVASLTVLDSEVPEADPDPCRYSSQREVLQKWIELIEMVLGHPLGLRSGELVSKSAADQLTAIHGRLVQFGLFPPKSMPGALAGPIRTFAAALRARYRPATVYSGTVSLALADDPKVDAASNHGSREQTIKGWRHWVADLRTFHAPGNHITMLNPPHVEALAAWIHQNARTSMGTGRLVP